MGDTKAIVRASALKRRETLSASDRDYKGRLIQNRALGFPLYLDCQSVALYSASGNEVATEIIREHALNARKRIFYPTLRAESAIEWVRLGGENEFIAGKYGILEPAGNERLTAEQADGLIVFVPGLAFDLCGRRLGRGQGWYDRALATLRGRAQAVALAYEFQVIEEVPTDAWDQGVQYIITEGRTIDCRNSGPVATRVPESLGMKRGC
jgi:5-formyltetrahydrofolate cyclo-ligase